MADQTQMSQPRASTQRRRTGPIGWAVLGLSAQTHQLVRRNFSDSASASPNVLLGVYDPNTAAAKAFADQHAVPFLLTRLDELAARHDIHCVYISGPLARREQLVHAALDAGKHILVDRQPAATPATAEQLVSSAHLRSLNLHSDTPWRRHPGIQKIRAMVADDAIGDLLGLRVMNARPLPLDEQIWRFRTQGGGVLMARTIETVDLLTFVLAREISEVYAVSGAGQQHQPQHELPEELFTTFVLHAFRESSPAQEATGARGWSSAQQSSAWGLSAQAFDSTNLPHVPSQLELYGVLGTLLVRHWIDGGDAVSVARLRHGQLSPVDADPSHRPSASPVQRMAAAVVAGQATVDDKTIMTGQLVAEAIGNSLVRRCPISVPRWQRMG